MSSPVHLPELPVYQGAHWLSVSLPPRVCEWMQQPDAWRFDGPLDPSLPQELSRLADPNQWQWPSRLILFITDLHADVEAFSASLVASGLFRREGPQPEQIALIETAPPFELIIGGDCLDKGPANLPLLRLLRSLYDLAIPITLLSGNHDLRLQLAINTLESPDNPQSSHFLVRLGSKVMPLCIELLQDYPLSAEETAALPSEQTCQMRLLPNEHWTHAFQQEAKTQLTAAQISTEIQRLEARKQRFLQAARKAQLSMQQIYAALLRWRALFMRADGEFHWFIQRQQLLCQRGSFVFVHAGCDDAMAERLAQEGVEPLNQAYALARQGDAFQLYFSPLGNMLRTKYRHQDPPLSATRRAALHQAGIHALVHGHRNLHRGQRLTIRANLLHFECDTTLNRNSRQDEGLVGVGAAATLFYPQGGILAISNDFAAAKYFHPAQLSDLNSAVLKQQGRD